MKCYDHIATDFDQLHCIIGPFRNFWFSATSPVFHCADFELAELDNSVMETTGVSSGSGWGGGEGGCFGVFPGGCCVGWTFTTNGGYSYLVKRVYYIVVVVVIGVVGRTLET